MDRLKGFIFNARTTGTTTTPLGPLIMVSLVMAAALSIRQDDGSAFYTDTQNFLMYGGAKNFLGQKKRSEQNYYIYADLNGFKALWLARQALNSHMFLPRSVQLMTAQPPKVQVMFLPTTRA